MSACFAKVHPKLLDLPRAPGRLGHDHDVIHSNGRQLPARLHNAFDMRPASQLTVSNTREISRHCIYMIWLERFFQ